MSGLIAVGHFLVTLFFDLLLLVLWARMFLRFCKISSLHPLSQAINSFANPLINPIANKLPLKKGQSSPYDWACFTVIVIAEIIKYLLLGFLLYKTLIPLGYMILFVAIDLICQPCNLLFYMVLIRIVMSWVKPDWKTPLEEVIKIITDPILIFARNLIPNIAGFDLSPFIVLITLKVITLFMTASLPIRLV